MKIVFSFIFRIVQWFIGLIKFPVAKIDRPGSPEWLAVPFPEQIEKAKDEFARLIDGFRGYWGTYNVHYIWGGSSASCVKLKWTFDKENEKSSFEIESKTRITQKEMFRIEKENKYFTMCNQVASLFSQECLGYDLDFADLTDDEVDETKEFNANAICKNLSKGSYNKKNERWKEVSHSQALTHASENCLVMATLYKKGGIGHIATMNQNGTFCQAGKYTGPFIRPEMAFGASNLSKVKYYVLQRKS